MSYKVVIIDDEPWTRGVIMNLAQWSQLNMEVVGEAADGETGLALIERVCPDVIITDVRMPRINGLDLVKKLRERGDQTPVLIISGYDEFDYVRSALKLGVTDYLLKPIKANELNQQLKRCVNSVQHNESSQTRHPVQAGFFADGWQEAYEDIRSKITTALKVGNQEMIIKQFDRLRTVLYDIEGDRPSDVTLIGVYYAIMFPLIKFADNQELARNELFVGKSTVYVFGGDRTSSQMLDFMLDLYLTAMRQIERTKQKNFRLDIEQVCQYLKDNYAQGVTLEQTADAFHISKEYLSRAFKQHKKEGFAEYVTALRMRRAYELIADYNAPLKDIAEMVGYYDLAHFYKNFKKFYGKTPGEVREKIKKDNETGCPEKM